MNIVGKITGVKYEIVFSELLKSIDFKDFDINNAPSACIVNNNKNSFAISKWVSPKRTRSYPFERVYNTLNISKKITVIPIIKDEGAGGDRDYIQWDTVSLMSLLDVYVIFAYYTKADKAKLKITNQKFDNNYVLSKIKEIEKYHSSALHWNLEELNSNLHNILDKVKTSYREIEKSTKVKLHNESGIDIFKSKIGVDISEFMAFSRDKSKKAAEREFVTIQPKESLSTLSKAKVTITNYLGGQYFLTVDEILINKNLISLIEGKHSVNSKLPSKGDIKDGLLKLILYSNLTEVTVNKIKMKSEAVLCLTSSKIVGNINSSSSAIAITKFKTSNNFTTPQLKIIDSLISEAKKNNVIIKIQYSK